MNREQIVKALACCGGDELTCCKDCYLYGHTFCEWDLKSAVYLLVNTLTIELDAMRGAANSYKMHYDKVTEENERLRAGNERFKAQRYMVCSDGTLEMIPTVDQVKADTVRKMHDMIKERCIKGGIYPAFVARIVDEVAKELIDNET